jgi:PEP-CTERM motif
MNNETRLGLAAVSAFAVFCTSANAAPAVLVNQGYESGLAGWTSSGDVTATSDSSVINNNGEWIIAPYQTQMAQLNSNSIDAPDLDTFFGLDAGTIDAIDAAVGGDVANGAGIQQSFTGLSGETVTQFWDYVARDYAPYNDPAFVVINGQVTTLASIHNGGIEVGDFGHSGWQSFSYTLPADGTYTIGFGVVNTLDTVLDGALFLDNQAGDARLIPAIPEPETYAMLVAGLGLLGFMAKRKNLLSA